MIGVGYRRELAEWIGTRPAGLDCLELTAEHFYGEGAGMLPGLRQSFHLFVHSLGLSLGTPGPLDSKRLEQFARVVELADPDWISEHVAFTRTEEVDLGHLNPLCPTRRSARVVADHARQIQDRCGKPLLLENITSHIRLQGEMDEPEFLNTVCEMSGCGLLLDVTNLYINSRNHRFDPLSWLGSLDASRIRQMHIVGCSEEGGLWTDDHAEPVQLDLIELARAIVDRAPVEAIILERDANFPSGEMMHQELAKLRRILGAN